MSKDIITNDFITEYLRDFTRRVYGAHLGKVEELAAAFIARNGCDPSDAEVVTHFDEAAMTWTSHIERRKRGSTIDPRHQSTVPRLP
jgi:hypothetical protein